jgi:hypothetical protein
MSASSTRGHLRVLVVHPLRERLYAALFCALFAAGLLIGALGHPLIGTVGMLSFAVMPVVLNLRRRHEVDVAVRDKTLHLGHASVPLARVATLGMTSAGPALAKGETRLTMADEAGAVLAQLDFSSMDALRGFLKEAGLDGEERRFGMGDGTRAIFLPRRELVFFFLIALGLWAASFAVLGNSFYLLNSFFGMAAFAPFRSVVVGRDGVELRWLLKKRFVPFAQIASVTSADHVVLRLKSGETLKLPIATSDDAAAARAELGQRILDRLAAFHASASSVSGVRIATNPEPYRAADLPAEARLALVNNPAAPLEVRVAEAEWLAEHDPGLLDDITRAAEQSADPEVRAALLQTTEVRKRSAPR